MLPLSLICLKLRVRKNGKSKCTYWASHGVVSTSNGFVIHNSYNAHHLHYHFPNNNYLVLALWALFLVYDYVKKFIKLYVIFVIKIKKYWNNKYFHHIKIQRLVLIDSPMIIIEGKEVWKMKRRSEVYWGDLKSYLGSWSSLSLAIQPTYPLNYSKKK